MITVRKSPTADTRTCDWSKVTKEQLERSSSQHIQDVMRGLEFFADRLRIAALSHDSDKLSALDHFHADFQTGFKQTGWWDEHRRISRHHLNVADGVPHDVNLVDVIEHVVDCVMAGMARSGEVHPLVLRDGFLQRAFQNTVTLLMQNVQVEA